ncbi:MAG: hypothetical protein N2259_00955 [Patescibacteria group bacterium]|nr:hypothetical protein [Patescibacteria group bacterium]
MSEGGPEQPLSRSELLLEKQLQEQEQEQEQEKDREKRRQLNNLDLKRVELLNQRAEIEAKKELLQADPANRDRLLILDQELKRVERKIENVSRKIQRLGADWIRVRD